MIHGPVGRRKVGKTTLVDYLCRLLTYQIRFSPRVTLPDRGVHYTIAPTPTQLAGHLSRKECVTVVPDHNVNETFLQLAFVVRQWYARQEAHLKASGETVGFIVDEARFSAVRESEDLDWLFRCTVPEIFHTYLTVHRPKDLHPDIRAILDYWYVFHVTQARDLEVLEEECNSFIAASAANLKPREFYVFDVGEQKHRHWTPAMAETWKPLGAPRERGIVTTGSADLLAASDEDFELL